MKTMLTTDQLGMLEEKFGTTVAKGLEVIRTDGIVVSTVEGQHIARISTDDVDRSADVVLPEGMDATEYKKNPVACWNHNYSIPPIGKATTLQISDHAVHATLEFGDTKLARDLQSLVKQGILRGVSVGFAVVEAVHRGEKAFTALISRLAHLGEKAREVERIITKWVLLEFSLVTLGANQEALIVAVSKGLSPDCIKALGKAAELPAVEPVTPVIAVPPTAEPAVVPVVEPVVPPVAPVVEPPPPVIVVPPAAEPAEPTAEPATEVVPPVAPPVAPPAPVIPPTQPSYWRIVSPPAKALAEVEMKRRQGKIR